jgi:hypothetical protein
VEDREMKLNANQLRHLQRVAGEPGTIDAHTTQGNGWNALTFRSLLKRGLLRTEQVERVTSSGRTWPTEYYHITPAGEEALR